MSTQLTDAGRLARYGVSGACSAATHVGLLFGLAEGLAVPPVAASAAGFVASIVVSYVLQRGWVFRSARRHTVTGGRFLAVTAVAFLVNGSVVWVGTGPAGLPYPLAQAVALVLVPVTNYLLNATWTFR